MTLEFPAISVSQLTWQLKELVEESFPYVYVKGELSNVKRSRPGHIYLTLKDEDAQISGVIWRSKAARLKFDPQDGLDIFCLLYTSPSPRDATLSRMPSSA